MYNVGPTSTSVDYEMKLCCVNALNLAFTWWSFSFVDGRMMGWK